MNSSILLLLLVVGWVNADLLVYSGATGTLASGWNDFSWATHSLTSTASVKSGDTYVRGVERVELSIRDERREIIFC
jgi:hypothetical protein